MEPRGLASRSSVTERATRADGHRHLHPLWNRSAAGSASSCSSRAFTIAQASAQSRRTSSNAQASGSPTRTSRCIVTKSSSGRSIRWTRSEARSAARACHSFRPHARLQSADRHRQHVPEMGTVPQRLGWRRAREPSGIRVTRFLRKYRRSRCSSPDFRAPAQIIISNVAGTRVRSTIIRVIEVWPDAPAPYWLIPLEEQCGVINRYRNPAQLGSDRWAALIGARELLGRSRRWWSCAAPRRRSTSSPPQASSRAA